MFGESKISDKYVVLLFSVFSILVIGNLIMEFEVFDFIYLIFLLLMIVRYVKIKLIKE